MFNLALHIRVILFPILSYIVLSVYAESCPYAESSRTGQRPKCPHNYTSTNARLVAATPYRFVANLDDSPVQYPGCQPTGIWSIIRHGTRRPNIGILRWMSEDLGPIRDQIVRTNELCAEELERFRKWSAPSVADEKFLMPEGLDELQKLAERMQNRFPQLLPDEYRNESFRFKFTESQRTRKSFEAFATGLFGANNIANVWYPQPLSADPILRFYKLCPRWPIEVKRNPLTVAAVDAFRKSPQIKWATQIISKRAGLPRDLTEREARLLYLTCAFETAWNRHQPASPWCSLFDDRTAAVFEYLEDLKYYHLGGYAQSLTYQQACPALNDMLQRLLSAGEPGMPAATVYFTHSGSMLKFLGLLGLYRDAEPLSSANFERQHQRQWRTSRIDVFGSNFAFVKYNCSGIDHLLVQHQERAVRLTGCPTDSDLCPMAQVQSAFQHTLGDQCRFDEMCRLPEQREEL